MNQSKSRLGFIGFNGKWSMGVGGMIGGGIFSTLGVVGGIAGAGAWLSFTAAGLIALAAAFSIGSAINAKLFATAHLAYKVAEDSELPAVLDHKNRAGIPNRAVMGLGGAAVVLAAVGTLTTLVEAASLAFLFTFAVVCGLAFRQRAGVRGATGFGAVAGADASVAFIVRLIRTDPLAPAFLGLLVLFAVFGRLVCYAT